MLFVVLTVLLLTTTIASPHPQQQTHGTDGDDGNLEVRSFNSDFIDAALTAAHGGSKAATDFLGVVKDVHSKFSKYYK